MSTLISKGGNWTTSSSWGLAETISLLNSETNNTNITTSYVNSQTFTPGVVTIDGIAIKINTRNSSPSGTLSVALDQGGSTVVGTEIAVNISDIAYDYGQGFLGWYFFKFPATFTFLAATAYSIKIKTSVASQINVFRDATAGNWSRLLRTTTTSSPNVNDNIVICGEINNLLTNSITMNDTSGNSYGSLEISKLGELNYENSTFTNYNSKLQGILRVSSEGTLDFGIMPNTSSATLTFDVLLNVSSGLEVYANAIFNGEGAGKVVRTNLTANANIGDTVIQIIDTTGWQNGDEVVFAATITNPLSELAKISNVDSSTQITLTASLSNNHENTAIVSNIYRNIKIRGVDETLQSYIHIHDGANCSLTYCEFLYLGSSITNKNGINVDMGLEGLSIGSFFMNFCSIHDNLYNGSYGIATNDYGKNITITNTSTYNINDIHMLLIPTSYPFVFSNNLNMMLTTTIVDFNLQADAPVNNIVIRKIRKVV